MSVASRDMGAQGSIEELYHVLCEQFDEHGTLDRGGTQLIYISGEQCVSRLNETVGPNNWDFRITGFHHSNDEVSVLGELTVRWPDGTVSIKQQYGCADYSSRTDRLKSAATDALKKCASLVGVGLYLFNKVDRLAVTDTMRSNGQLNAPSQRSAPAGGYTGPRALPASQGNGAAIACEYCGSPVTGGEFSDGKPFSAEQAAGWGRKKYQMALCSEHYRAANRGQLDLSGVGGGGYDASDSVPF